LTEQGKLEVIGLLREFWEVSTILQENSIKSATEEPVYSKPYPIRHAMQAEVKKELDTMMTLGVIETPTLAYASPETGRH